MTSRPTVQAAPKSIAVGFLTTRDAYASVGEKPGDRHRFNGDGKEAADGGKGKAKIENVRERVSQISIAFLANKSFTVRDSFRFCSFRAGDLIFLMKYSSAA